MIAYDSLSIIDVTDGQTLYTWHMYADDKEGNGISSDPTDKAYVGVAYNQTTEMPPDDVDPSIFTWSLWEPPPIVVENQIAQYVFGNKDEPLTDSNKENDGWSNECPNPWEHLDSEKKPLYYVWRRYETHWSNDATTYVGLMILDDYEVANVLAQQAGYRSVGAWCQKEGRTIIDGSTIMTGTINANRLDVNSLKVNEDFQVVITQPVKDLEIGGRNLIKLSQLTAVNCTIGATSTNNIEVSSVTSGNMAIMKINGSHEPGSYILNATGSKSNKDFRVLFDKNYDGSCTYNAYYAGHGYPYFKDYTSMPLKLTFTEATSIGLVMKSDVGAQTITGLKLEVGNTMATDWTPAPEDMATAAELKVTNDKISTKVESSTYESGLTQLADQMVAKVHNKETGDNCSWTMTPESFNISATASGKEGGIIVDGNGLTVDGIVNAQAGGSIGGWDITENGIEKKDGDNSLVGMHSGDESYASLVDSTTTSPVRFYAGEWHEAPTDRERAKTLTFPTSDGGWSQSIVLTEEEQKGAFISSAECLTTNQTHSISESYNVTISASTTWQGSGYPITAQTITIPISYTAANDNVIITAASSTHSLVNFDYKGGGQVYISGYSRQSGNQSMNIQYSYQYEEILNVDVSHNESTVTCVLKPDVVNASYSLDVQYILARQPRNFQVLEDGSLYANAVKIKGNSSFNGVIYASDGKFTGDVEAEKGRVGGFKIQKNGIYAEDGLLSLDSTGQIIADDITGTSVKTSKISGTNTASAYLLLDENSSDVEPNTFTYTTKVVTGNAGLGIVTNEGEVKIIIKSTEPATRDFKFELIANYYKQVASLYYDLVDCKDHRKAQVVLKAGSQSVSYTFPYYVKKYNVLLEKTVILPCTSENVYFINDKNEMQTMYNRTITVNQPVVTVQNIKTNANILPAGTGYQTIGVENNRWDEIWCDRELNTSSDRNVKNSIEAIPSEYEMFFDELQPVRYKFNVNNSNRYHTGLISQDVRDALNKAQIPTSDFAGYLEYNKEDGTKGYGLRYGEFISLCIHEIQKLKKRVNELEEKLDTTK